jgi:xylulokinase
MATEALLALDVGTSGCRAELLTLEGRPLGRCYREYGIQTPAPGAAEQDPEQWWQAVVACARGARDECPEGARVVAVGLSVQGHTWLPVDAAGQALRPALTWLDARAAGQARRLLEEHGAAFWGQLAGKLPGPSHLLPQWLWLREAEPEVAARMTRCLFCHDWLVERLTGRAVTDFTHAATSLLYDIERWEWSSLAAEYGLPEGALPPVVPAGRVAGRVADKGVAAVLGAELGTIVAVGAQDQKCAALAAGLDAATATVSMGTAVAIEAPVPAPRFDASLGAIPCFPWLERGRWVLEAPMTSGGGAFRWLRDLLAETEATSFDRLIAEAEAVPPGAEGVRFLPYLAGAGAPHWQPEATAAFTGMTLRTGRGHLARALLEGVAADIRANVDCMRALGCPIERLRLFGGGVRSGLWPQIIAAVCTLPTEACTEAEAATRGAAMLAARALGVDPGVFALAARPVTVPEGWAEAYTGMLADYATLRQRLVP